MTEISDSLTSQFTKTLNHKYAGFISVSTNFISRVLPSLLDGDYQIQGFGPWNNYLCERKTQKEKNNIKKTSFTCKFLWRSQILKELFHQIKNYNNNLREKLPRLVCTACKTTPSLSPCHVIVVSPRVITICRHQLWKFRVKYAFVGESASSNTRENTFLKLHFKVAFYTRLHFRFVFFSMVYDAPAGQEVSWSSSLVDW